MLKNSKKYIAAVLVAAVSAQTSIPQAIAANSAVPTNEINPSVNIKVQGDFKDSVNVGLVRASGQEISAASVGKDQIASLPVTGITGKENITVKVKDEKVKLTGIQCIAKEVKNGEGRTVLPANAGNAGGVIDAQGNIVQPNNDTPQGDNPFAGFGTGSSSSSSGSSGSSSFETGGDQSSSSSSGSSGSSSSSSGSSSGSSGSTSSSGASGTTTGGTSAGDNTGGKDNTDKNNGTGTTNPGGKPGGTSGGSGSSSSSSGGVSGSISGSLGPIGAAIAGIPGIGAIAGPILNAFKTGDIKGAVNALLDSPVGNFLSPDVKARLKDPAVQDKILANATNIERVKQAAAAIGGDVNNPTNPANLSVLTTLAQDVNTFDKFLSVLSGEAPASLGDAEPANLLADPNFNWKTASIDMRIARINAYYTQEILAAGLPEDITLLALKDIASDETQAQIRKEVTNPENIEEIQHYVEMKGAGDEAELAGALDPVSILNNPDVLGIVKGLKDLPVIGTFINVLKGLPFVDTLLGGLGWLINIIPDSVLNIGAGMLNSFLAAHGIPIQFTGSSIKGAFKFIKAILNDDNPEKTLQDLNKKVTGGDKKPGDKDKKPGDAGKKPGDAGKKPGDAGKKPGDKDKKPTTGGSTGKTVVVEDTEKPDTPSKPATPVTPPAAGNASHEQKWMTSSKAEDPKKVFTVSTGNLPASITGEKSDTVSMSINGGQEINCVLTVKDADADKDKEKEKTALDDYIAKQEAEADKIRDDMRRREQELARQQAALNSQRAAVAAQPVAGPKVDTGGSIEKSWWEKFIDLFR